jgi:hypothetical protein
METLDCQSGPLTTGSIQLDNSGLCQTDEHKAAEQQNSVDMSRHQQSARLEVKVPCVADTGKSAMFLNKVCQHFPDLRIQTVNMSRNIIFISSFSLIKLQFL